MQFTNLPLDHRIQKAIQEIGYTQCTDIQAQSIPQVLAGKDILGTAQTGTGKTASFVLPIIQQLLHKPKSGIQSLILTPTRELAIQIFDNAKSYAAHVNVKFLAIYGGVSQFHQVQALKRGVDVLIATPGRLLDLQQQGLVDLSNIKILVLDEADHMLDIGFIHDIKKVLKWIPKQRQTLFFSATMPKEIKSFAHTILTNPVEVAVAKVSSTATTVQQKVFHVEKAEKSNLLIDLIKQSEERKTLVFTRTKHGADKLVKKLKKSGLEAAAIHGDKSQNSRQKALAEFKANHIDILVATDIAARGIDISELPQVINYELPSVPETYVHRIGRTGRAGHGGMAISFCDSDQQKELKNIEKLIGFRLETNQNNLIKSSSK